MSDVVIHDGVLCCRLRMTLCMAMFVSSYYRCHRYNILVYNVLVHVYLFYYCCVRDDDDDDDDDDDNDEDNQ